jgi:hypothetical protein
MSRDKFATLLAVAAIGARAGFQSTANTAYTETRDRQRAAQAAALAKKQRVREQIRARRADKGGAA